MKLGRTDSTVFTEKKADFQASGYSMSICNWLLQGQLEARPLASSNNPVAACWPSNHMDV